MSEVNTEKTVTEQLIEEINKIVTSRNMIRDRLTSDAWSGIVDSEATLLDIARAICDVPTPGKLMLSGKAGETVTIPQGYHPGTGVVLCLNDDDADLERYKLYDQPDVTPTKADQIISIPENHWGLESFTVKAIPHPYHDVSGVTAPASMVHPSYKYVDNQGVLRPGGMTVHNPDSKVVISLKPSLTYHDIQKDTYYSTYCTYRVQMGQTESVVLTPTKSMQIIHATENDKYFDKVIVNAIPEKWVDGENLIAILKTI